ncbi:ATP-binding protein [Streptomyces sp. NPDC050204]|uniref:ATP-binding protein n=1 Tax=Streptomyces sp. NPDC050204 TaxID=3155514 RepID=UPI003419937A
MRGEQVRQARVILPGLGAKDVGPLRRIVALHLGLWQVSRLADDATLGITELLANAVYHAGGECELLLRRQQDGLLVAVTDASPERIQLPDAVQDAENGRGLCLVRALTSDMGVDYTPAGKRVWFRLALHSARLA